MPAGSFSPRDTVAISPRQWRGLIAALGIGAGIAAIEQDRGVDLSKDEGLRFSHRDAINPLIAQAVSKLDFDAVSASFEAHEVCWGPYQSLRDTVLHHPELQPDSELIDQIDHPSGASYRTPGSPAQYSASARQTVQPSPKLGANTESVLADIMGLSSAEIGSLLERGIVAGSD